MPTAAAAVRGSSAHQLARQPKATVSRPPSSGPARLDMPALAPQIPRALPRRSGGKPDTAPASAAGLTSPAAGALDDAGDEQRVEALGQRPGERADGEQTQTAQCQPTGAEPVDELAAGRSTSA